MSIVHPHPNVHVTETPDELVLDLPSPRRPLTAFVVGLWLLGWVVGMTFIVQQFEPGQPTQTDRGFLLVFGSAWLVAGALAMAWLAWLVAGRERVLVREDSVTIRRGVPGITVRRTYPVAGITELRTFGREVPPLLAAGLDFTGRGASGVRFRCDGRVVRFARALDEHAAHALVDMLRARHIGAERAGTEVEGAA